MTLSEEELEVLGLLVDIRAGVPNANDDLINLITEMYGEEEEEEEDD